MAINNEEIILNVETNNPYVIGAIAYVEQLENGAKITIIDKNGTTVATVDDGNGIQSVTLNDDYTLTIYYTDGTSVTTTSIRGETGESGVYIGEEEPTNPDVNVWVDPSGDDGSVLKIKDENVWSPIETIVGEAAGFGTVTATADINVGTPSVTVTSSGEDTAKNFAFAFHNLGYDDSDLQSDFADLADDFDVLQGQFDTAVAALTVDSEVADIRVGDDGTTYASAGAAVRGQVSDLKSAISDIAVEFITAQDTANIGNLYAPFVQGELDGINIYSATKYRVVTQNIFTPYADVLLTIASGFQIGYSTCDSEGTYIAFSGWKSGAIKLPTDNRMRLCIRRATENTSEIANIHEFTSAVKASTVVDNIKDLNKYIVSLNNGKKLTLVKDYDYYKNRRDTGGALVGDSKSCVSASPYNLKAGDVINIKSGYVICLNRPDGTYYANWTSTSYTMQSTETVYIEVRNSTLTNLTADQIAEMPDVITISADVVYGEEISALRGECFISPNGIDTNDGSKTNPFATISHAISKGYRNICLLQGVYTEVVNVSSINNIKIYADNYMQFSQFPDTPRERPTFTNGTKYTAFTDGDSYRYFALATAPTRYTEVFISQSRTPTEIINGRTKNSAGLWANFANRYEDKQLKPVLSLSALSESDTFYYDGTNVYFNTDADINGVTVVGNNATQVTFSNCNNVEISGINFEYGFSRNLYMPWCNGIRIENCEFGHTIQSHNSEFTMSDVTLVNCLSYLAGLDGYNSSYYGVTRLVNCKGIYNFDDGESSHEYCEIIVEGGEYAYNGKGGHAPVHGCKFSCNGTYTHHNLYGFYLIANSNYVLPNSLLISNTVAINNTLYDLSNTLYNTLLMNCKIGTKQITSGTVTDLTA